jgi:signal transduction histidine kinase
MDLLVSERLREAPATLIRSLDGRILQWSVEMERLYGFSRDQAIGATAHHLLRTRFPSALPDIEATLVAHRRWSGGLIQRGSCGRAVMVASHWYLNRKCESERGMVTEIHARLAPDGNAESSHCADVLAGLIHSLSEPLTAIGAYGAASRVSSGGDARQMRIALQEIGAQAQRMGEAVRLLRDLADAMRTPG